MILNATISRDRLEAMIAPAMTLESNQLLCIEPDEIEINCYG